MFVNRGALNIFSNTTAGKILRAMLYLLVLLAPLLAWFAARR